MLAIAVEPRRQQKFARSTRSPKVAHERPDDHRPAEQGHRDDYYRTKPDILSSDAASALRPERRQRLRSCKILGCHGTVSSLPSRNIRKMLFMIKPHSGRLRVNVD